jgi:hypothetical protein
VPLIVFCFGHQGLSFDAASGLGRFAVAVSSLTSRAAGTKEVPARVAPL